MLYILLIIIAVGVLLASEGGKELLGWIIWLAMIAGGLYLGFWIVVIIIGLFSDKEIRDNILTVLGTIMLTAYAGYGVYLLYKKIKKGELTTQIIKKKAKDLWLEKWRESKTSKVLIVFVILAFSFIAIMLIKSFTINGFWQQ